MKKLILLPIIVSLLNSINLNAQVSNVFIARDYSGEGSGRAMVMDNSGNIFVCGDVSNLYTVSKYSAQGEIIWSSKQTEGKAYNLFLSGNSYIYTAGILTSGSSKDVIVRKVDTSSSVLWTKILESNINFSDYVNIISDHNGNSLVNYSIQDSNAQTTEYVVKKCDSQGNVLYTFRRTQPGYGESKIKSDANGNLYQLYCEAFEIEKLNSSGSSLWKKAYNESDSNYASDLDIDANANVYLIGTQINPGTERDFATVKYNSSGTLQWSRFYNNDSALTHNFDEGVCISIGSDGYIYSVGEAHRGNQPGAYKCLRVIKYDQNGNEIWHTNSFTTEIVGVRSVGVDYQSNVYVGYNQRGLNGGSIHPAFIRKFSSSGDPVWVEAGYTRENLYQLVVDGSYNVYTVGMSKNSLDGYLLTLRKYGQSSVGITNTGTQLDYSLSQNYPNPFNPTTDINFTIKKQGFVKIVIYNQLGKEIRTLVNKPLQAGEYRYTFNASGLSSGIYFYKLSVNDFTETRKMILLK